MFHLDFEEEWRTIEIQDSLFANVRLKPISCSCSNTEIGTWKVDAFFKMLKYNISNLRCPFFLSPTGVEWLTGVPRFSSSNFLTPRSKLGILETAYSSASNWLYTLYIALYTLELETLESSSNTFKSVQKASNVSSAKQNLETESQCVRIVYKRMSAAC